MENNSNSLAKISIGINIALIIAVIILFVKMPSSGGGETTGVLDPNDSTRKVLPDDGQLRIGYFIADSLQENILVMKEIEQLMLESQQRAEETMATEERKVQSFEQKWSNVGALLPSEQAKYQAEGQQVQQNYMMAQQRVQAEFAQEQEKYTLSLIMRITNAATSYAEANGFDYIFSYQIGQNIYYGSPNFDVTDDLVRIMNADYNNNMNVGEAEPVEEMEGN